MSMNPTESTINYDALLREAQALRAQAIADFGRRVASFFRRAKPVAKPLLG